MLDGVKKNQYADVRLLERRGPSNRQPNYDYKLQLYFTALPLFLFVCSSNSFASAFLSNRPGRGGGQCYLCYFINSNFFPKKCSAFVLDKLM